MKQILLAVILVAALSGVAFACDDPPLICPDVAVTCECKCSEVRLTGLWEVNVDHVKKCGYIMIVGSGFILEELGREKSYFVTNKLKFARQVEKCDWY